MRRKHLKQSQRRTARGLTHYRLRDASGQNCTLHDSSSAMADCVWLGVAETPESASITPRVTPAGVGDSNLWESLATALPGYKISPQLMHLDKRMAAEMIVALQFFVDNGRLPQPKDMDKPPSKKDRDR